MENEVDATAELHGAIEAAIGDEGALLANWVVVAEYMKPGDPTPSIFYDSGETTSHATQKGLLHDALYGDAGEWDEEE